MPHFDMASIQKTAKGYRVQIKKLGIRDSQIFPTRREAVEWAARRESDISSEKHTPKGDRTSLRKVRQKYAEEVSPTKRGEKKELIRLAAFERYKLPLGTPISEITAQDIADFRDDLLRTVKVASVLRELNMLSSVFETARLEWGLVSNNPCKDIRRPAPPRHRNRVLKWSEIRAMLLRLGYPMKGQQAEMPKQAIAVCMMVALRTGMRAGELCALTWENVHDRHVHLPTTKNGKARDVPLSRKAKAEIERMRGWHNTLVFGITAASLDALFRKYRQAAKLSGFTWHDTRHTAATLISKRVDVLTLCKIFGWSDPRMAMIYYNPSAASIADMLGKIPAQFLSGNPTIYRTNLAFGDALLQRVVAHAKSFGGVLQVIAHHAFYRVVCSQAGRFDQHGLQLMPLNRQHITSQPYGHSTPQSPMPRTR